MGLKVGRGFYAIVDANSCIWRNGLQVTPIWLQFLCMSPHKATFQLLKAISDFECLPPQQQLSMG